MLSLHAALPISSVWNPLRGEWVERVPFRFAFIDAPEMGQALGSESMEFLHQLISGKALRLSPIGKESMGYLPIDQYKRMLCMAFLTEEMRSEEHTSELQSLMRISYAVFCLKNKNK